MIAGRRSLLAALLATAVAIAAGPVFVAPSGAGAAVHDTAQVAGVARLAHAAPNAAEPKAWIVVDADTGKVLEGRDFHTAYSPASMTKVMTGLTAVERLAPSTPVVVTADAQAKGRANLTPTGMQPGQHWSLDTTLGLLLVVSANDAAYSLATTTSGSLAAFAAAETETGHELGLRDSTFADPAGLDDASSYNGGPRMSAFDVAVSVRNALAVPELANWARTPQFSYTDPAGAHHTVTNHNKMLLAGSKHYDGTTGFKTGFTRRAGNTLVTTATRGGRTMIVVVMNTYDTYGWSAKLMDDGFGMAPTAAGTGEVVPPVHVVTYQQRATDRAAFLALTRGTSSTDPTASTLPDLASITTYHTTTTTAPPPTTAASTSAATHAKRATSGGAGGASRTSTPTNRTSDSGGNLAVHGFEFLIVLLAVAAVAVALRRRAVKRRRAKRLARRRATQAALRRGSLPVVDGRYRPGMRTGKPVQSHVKIHRGPDDAR